MVATIKQLARPRNPRSLPWVSWGLAALEVFAVYFLAQHSGWWPLAALVVVAVELRSWPRKAKPAKGARLAILWERLPGIMMGLSVALIIASVPRLATQVVAALLYGVWLAWREFETPETTNSMVQVLLVQAVAFEAIFLMAAIWQLPDGKSLPSWLIIGLVWLAAYFGVYSFLVRKADRLAGVLAATWGVIAAEVSWVLMLWLITYTMHGGYVLVPQPALILTALAYVFGSVLTASRQGSLSRARLGEYMVIALVLVVIVVAGTSWHGNV